MDTPPSSSRLRLPTTEGSGRNVRRRIEFDGTSPLQRPIIPVPSSLHEFKVYLPNRTHVVLKMEARACRNMSVHGFVEYVQTQQSPGVNGKKKAREICWGPHVILKDRTGKRLEDGGLIQHESPTIILLEDAHVDTVHSGPDLWNVTPEPHMLEALPQDYTFFSALADELDNSLQAVWCLRGEKRRLIRVELEQGKITIFDTGKGMDSSLENSISKWGTIGHSTSRDMVTEGIGGEPPYLKPYFGMYGFGGISAGLHLGGFITVSSKTQHAEKVAVLCISKDNLLKDIKRGSIWKTPGEIRAPTQEEREMSPHGSFTKVEITDLNHKVQSWKADEVQRKLKDFYYPYIQVDKNGRTVRPVDILVNGKDLAEVVGGEVATTYSLSGNGDPFVLSFEFTKLREQSEPGRGIDKAHGCVTCHYFPFRKGKEALDEVLEELRREDLEFMDENFDTLSRVAIRRLGRLLPDARMKRLPFMEPKKGSNPVTKECFKRVKAFIDIDAGFVPTPAKMDLMSKHLFTEALMSLGLAECGNTKSTLKSSRQRGGVTMVLKVKVDGKTVKSISPDQLRSVYTDWVHKMHAEFDIGATFDEERGTFVFTKLYHRTNPLNIKTDVFQVLDYIKYRKIEWTLSGSDQPPVRLKLLRGLPGLSRDSPTLYVTVEFFVCEFSATSGGGSEAKIMICRPIDVPPEKGSRLILGNDPDFSLGLSRVFPIDILSCTDKIVDITNDHAKWKKQEEKLQTEAPSFIELLSKSEAIKFDAEGGIRDNAILKAGTKLPAELIAVVRPRSFKKDTCKGQSVPSLSGTSSKSKGGSSGRTEQKFLVTEPLEMQLTVQAFPFQPPQNSVNKEKGSEIFISKPTRMTLRCNVRGLYCFKVAAEKSLDIINTKMGTYLLTFALVSEKYNNVTPARVRLNVSASDSGNRWKVCTHMGACASVHPACKSPCVKARLDGDLDGELFLSRQDEFDNPVRFLETLNDIHCELLTPAGDPLEIHATISEDPQLTPDHFYLRLPKIELSSGDLKSIPDHRAALHIFIEKKQVSMVDITVQPGYMAKAVVVENEAPVKPLRPGKMIERLVFQVSDKSGNAVSTAEEISLIPEGLELLDGKGRCNKFRVDANSCLDLSGRLRVKAKYGGSASVELQDKDGMCLGEITLEIMKRTLHILNEPGSATAGSTLQGIVIEVLDEGGNIDEEMTGPTYSLSLAWFSYPVPLLEGKGVLPEIRLPNTAGLWTGKVELAQHPEIRLLITLAVVAGESEEPPLLSDIPFEPLPSPKMEQPSFNHPPAILQKAQETQTLLKASMSRAKKLEQQSKNQGRKVGILEADLCELSGEIKIIEKELSLIKEQLKSLGLSSTNTADHDDDDILWNGNKNIYGALELITNLQTLGSPPGTHAASLLITAIQEDRSFKEGPGSDIIGIVALLATVKTDILSRALAGFLGEDKMTAIVCRSKIAKEFLVAYDADYMVDEGKGLHGFATRNNSRISGGKLVIVLNPESYYKRSDGEMSVDLDDPQKCLNMKSLTSGMEVPQPEGFLGYAVNLVRLDEKFVMQIKVGDRGLRETLFYRLFGDLQVYDTRKNMESAREFIRSSAVSLDGGEILNKDEIEFDLGCRKDPTIRFAVVQQSSSLQEQSKSLQWTNSKHRRLINKYEDRMRTNLAKVKALQQAKEKLEDTNKELAKEGACIKNLEATSAQLKLQWEARSSKCI